LTAACGSLAGVVLLQFALPVESLNFPQFVLFIPPYSVASCSPSRRALLGLAVCLAPVVAIDSTSSTTLSSWKFSIGAVALAWGVGRLIRARRQIAAELKGTTEQIAAERDSLERLAVAGQRTKIAEELQTVVAESVSRMIVQAEAAKRLLDENLGKADVAMATIEDTGRAALADMRRILGVLRHAGSEPDLAPLPGIGQIEKLVEQTRRSGCRVELRVEGDPRPVPACADLAVYRVLEGAIAAADLAGTPALQVTVTFAPESLQLEVQNSGTCLTWPTPAVCDLIELGDGRVDIEQVSGISAHLTVRFPINVAPIAT
jgi:signal transduction histidine kinase